MQETPAKRAKAAVAGPAGDQLRVSRYDRASSLLLALLVTVGTVAVLVFVVWATGKVIAPPKVALPIERVDLVRRGEGGGNGQASGGTQQLDAPSDEPGFGKDNQTPDVQDELKRMDVAAVSKKDGSLGTGGGRNRGIGPGDGLGNDDRPVGTPAPPARHWEVLFSQNTLDGYAKQLDFFKIELGVLLPDSKIIYACNLTKSKPDIRTVANPAASESRCYLTWRSGEMQQADRDLLARAGVDVGNSLVVKFLPPEVEERLVSLEKSYARADANRIKRTRFGVRADGAGFTFFVLEQPLKR
jgi:hypothetical protein